LGVLAILDPQELLLLKKKYGTSMAVWVYRAKDLGILSNNDTQRHWQAFSLRGWHKQEPGEPLAAEHLSGCTGWFDDC
jgi:Zn-dependent peptidase ImmA (M78 family)